MLRLLSLGFVLATLGDAVASPCSTFTGSTMDIGGYQKASWRDDYPQNPGAPATPWKGVDFRVDPTSYMDAVLSTARGSFSRSNKRLIGTGSEQWWVSQWLDYTTSGREPLMGLTKERGPDAGDLSPTSSDGYQVWAIGFYNAAGATVLHEVFADPCMPNLPPELKFPEGTVSVKFLFTDAQPSEVMYLMGGPEYDAVIDAAGPSGLNPPPVAARGRRPVRLLQVDIAVKDSDSTQTGWVFGTYGWVGPMKGDGLFDNLVPVSLQWGNDPKIYSQSIVESWINPTLQGVMYGWNQRPTLGFNGRANGPADNIRSSCLSCHAAARTPRSSRGLLGSRFDMADINNPAKVKQHVDIWFENVKGGELFQPQEPAVSALDYSLQVEAAIYRMCLACRAGDRPGSTPSVCIDAGFYDQVQCQPAILPTDLTGVRIREQLQSVAPPRQ